MTWQVEEDPSANPREDGVVNFETPTLPLTHEQEAELARKLTSASEEYGIDQYVNGLQLLDHFCYTTVIVQYVLQLNASQKYLKLTASLPR